MWGRDLGSVYVGPLRTVFKGFPPVAGALAFVMQSVALWLWDISATFWAWKGLALVRTTIHIFDSLQWALNGAICLRLFVSKLSSQTRQHANRVRTQEERAHKLRHMCDHTHGHTYTHTGTHTPTRAHTHTHGHTWMHIHTGMHTGIRACTHMHACTDRNYKD